MSRQKESYGGGDLQRKGWDRFVEIMSGTGWPYDGTMQIPQNRAEPKQGTLLYLESPDGLRKYDVPFLAKGYFITKYGGQWWSVSKRLLDAATSDLLFTYVNSTNEVYVTNKLNARVDEGDLRFGDTYRGWNLEQAVFLKDWLRDPSKLSVQSTL